MDDDRCDPDPFHDDADVAEPLAEWAARGVALEIMPALAKHLVATHLKVVATIGDVSFLDLLYFMLASTHRNFLLCVAGMLESGIDAEEIRSVIAQMRDAAIVDRAAGTLASAGEAAAVKAGAAFGATLGVAHAAAYDTLQRKRS